MMLNTTTDSFSETLGGGAYYVTGDGHEGTKECDNHPGGT